MTVFKGWEARGDQEVKRPPIVTKHARKRVENDQRTALTVEEVLSLANSPFATKEDGQRRWVYSGKDDKTLTIVTGKQGSVLVTVYGTERHPNRLVDMVCRAKAGLDVPFSETHIPADFSRKNVAEVCIGEFHTKRDGSSRVDTEFSVVSCFSFTRSDQSVLESRWIHESVVSAVESLWQEGQLSNAQKKKLHTLIMLDDGTFGSLPIWVSFALLKLKYPP